MEREGARSLPLSELRLRCGLDDKRAPVNGALIVKTKEDIKKRPTLTALAVVEESVLCCNQEQKNLQRSSERRTDTKKRGFGTTPFQQTVILKNCNHFGEHYTIKNPYIQVSYSFIIHFLLK